MEFKTITTNNSIIRYLCTTNKPFRTDKYTDSSYLLSMTVPAQQYSQETYIADRKLGSGSYGVVYSATRESDKSTVAVKTIRREEIRSYDYVNSFRVPSEISTMLLLKEVENVVKILDWSATKEEVYIIMEKPEDSMNLFEYVKENRIFGEYQSKQLFSSLVKTVEEIHEKGVAHNDLRDRNTLVCKNESGDLCLKIIDFGLAKIMKTEEIEVMRQNNSSSTPDQELRTHFKLRTASVYALGTILIQLATTCDPHYDCNVDEIFELPDDMDVSTSCQDLLIRCLEFNYESRLDLSDIKNHDWLLD